MFNVRSLFYTSAKLQASVCSMSIHSLFYTSAKLQASVCSMSIQSLLYTRAKLQAGVCSVSIHYSTLELSYRLVDVQCLFTILEISCRLVCVQCPFDHYSTLELGSQVFGVFFYFYFFIGGSCTFRGFLPQAFCVVFAITDSFPFSSFARHGFETVAC